ncbi:hypothetical protein ACFFNY_02900 [Paenibacillus hodogayensis]|uniref:Uncharacterized protein n=1 Tax=Paenibacillus hodogayensis TaxID=279208 RepID=A0ABV5VQF3_9BACL
MFRYWLAPITRNEPIVLGGERLLCAPEEPWAEFRNQLESSRPRLLFPFKAHLLAGEEEAEACGRDPAPFELSTPGDVVFDGKPLHLSGCGRAVLDKLPSAEALAAWLAENGMQALSGLSVPGGAEDAPCLLDDALARWAANGLRVILLKEESNG